MQRGFPRCLPFCGFFPHHVSSLVLLTVQDLQHLILCFLTMKTTSSTTPNIHKNQQEMSPKNQRPNIEYCTETERVEKNSVLSDEPMINDRKCHLRSTLDHSRRLDGKQNLLLRELRRRRNSCGSSSSEAAHRQQQQQEEEMNPKEIRTAMATKSVRFNFIEVYEFEYGLGDNPSVSEGVPVAISYPSRHHSYHLVDVAKYEAYFPSEYRRTELFGNLKLGVSERAKMCVYSLDQYRVLIRALACGCWCCCSCCPSGEVAIWRCVFLNLSGFVPFTHTHTVF